MDKVLENSAEEEEEQRILDTYTNLLDENIHESDSDADDIQDVPVISYMRACKEGMARWRQHQTTITGFFTPQSDILL